MQAMTSLSPPPPHTAHAIDTKQRTRLMRSTRKIGALLGSTPQINTVPERPPIPVSLRPQGPRPQPQHREEKGGRPRTADSPSSPRGFEPMPNFVYSSANVGATLSAVSSRSSSQEQEQEGGKERERRKRRPTLKNTGKRSIEVPPPLILHLTAPSSRHYSLPYTPTSSASSSNSCSSSSTLTPGRTPSGTGALTPVTPVTPVSPTPTESRRKRMAKLTRTLGERIPPGLVFASRSRKASSASLRPAPSTATHDTVPPLPPRKDSLHPKSAGKAGRRRSMSVDFANVGVATHATYPPPTAPSRSSRVWVTSNSAGWWGEWNRRDIGEVQQQLRALKAR